MNMGNEVKNSPGQKKKYLHYSLQLNQMITAKPLALKLSNAQKVFHFWLGP